VVSHDRPELTLGAVASILASDAAARILLVDNNSGERTRAVLREAAASAPSVELLELDCDLGVAGARNLAVDELENEFVLLLDDDAELLPGALEHLLAALDANPPAAAAGPVVAGSDGSVADSGGWRHESSDSVDFTPIAAGLAVGDPALPPSGPCDWLGGTALLARRSLLERHPFDPQMQFFAASEWSYRVERATPGSLWRSREALVLRHAPPTPAWPRARTVEQLASLGHFEALYGRILGNVFALQPELVAQDGTRDLAAARLLLMFVQTQGTARTLQQLLCGGLAPLLPPAQPAPDPLFDAAAQLAGEELVRRLLARDATLARIEQGGWWRLRGRLLPLLRLASKLRSAQHAS
jgi:hypothetical protein